MDVDVGQLPAGKRKTCSDVDDLERPPGETSVDIPQNRFPYSITWSPLPCITCCLPCVGHMGVADSEGIIYDFAGPYTVGKGRMAFGSPTRYLPLDPRRVMGDAWDSSVARATGEYAERMHNIVLDNCHSMVARVLNYAGYDGVKGQNGGRAGGYNMFWLGTWVFFRAKYIGPMGVAKTWLPFVIVVTLVLYFTGLLSAPAER
mmetsp:Transcript_108615/g.306191  ORF Transcript_108615/g.306191 Transcript_108615/m.306191 type:complete len:203 (-) Transcript_108615:95-703(-)